MVVNAVFDQFYKISTEALLVLQHLVKVIRPLGKFKMPKNETQALKKTFLYTDIETNFEFRPFVLPLYECTLQKLGAQEVDQEVKDRAIACMGQIIANMGDALKSNLDACMPIFLERLRNEVTRLSAVKALTMIASSPLRVDLRSILADVIPALGSFLRKNQRALKLNTLSLLDTLVNFYFAYMNPEMLQLAIAQIPPLISEVDLHIAQLSLVLLTSVANKHPQAMIGVYESILPEIMSLVRSPLLQGTALACTMSLFQVLVQAKLPGLGYRQLLDMLRAPVLNAQAAQPLHKQVNAIALHSYLPRIFIILSYK